ncbi:hypothetical protein NGR_b17290 (plasmid) [Sinorhizobium fredii NGR234]|uniref:DUF982 domain-containing protein n=1 Tax=Sinorhizobium fredii (strain NBRC 101917 / NGR234) TaxID=394 RepID=Q6W279_SINFN|nr:DUF982 domain-containing protein [Sinorhizobium fredii]AAQ87138.1 Hypothetical protein RNGR00113 [Sinorhizobium fredii NGR234]ACP23180.1 hypothetical protein NGR_b17290 [Sinorhizobium fredii NGR234]
MFKAWNECVIVDLPDLDGIQIVWTPAEAATLLSEHWPVSHGSAYNAALNACTDAMLGTASDDEARRAFVAAAQEAKITMMR